MVRWKLVHALTGAEMRIGDDLAGVGGRGGRLVAFKPARSGFPNGEVHVQAPGRGWTEAHDASVFVAKVVPGR